MQVRRTYPGYAILAFLSLPSVTPAAEWSAPQRITIEAGAETAEHNNPAVAASSAGACVAVWSAKNTAAAANGGTDFDIWFSRSTDAGSAWSMPQKLNSDAPADIRDDLMPQIACDDAGNFLVVWEGHDDPANLPTDSDIYFSMSGNSGQTWSTIGTVNIDATSDGLCRDLRPCVATDRNGKWVVAWHAGKDEMLNLFGPSQILISTSTDMINWNSPSVPYPLIGNKTNPGIATDGGMQWVVACDSLGTETTAEDTHLVGEVVTFRSVDGGSTWSNYQTVSPMSTYYSFSREPRVAINAAGKCLLGYSRLQYRHSTETFDTHFAEYHRSEDGGVTWNFHARAPAAFPSHSAYQHVTVATSASHLFLGLSSYYDPAMTGRAIAGLFVDSGDPNPFEDITSEGETHSPHDLYPSGAGWGSGNWLVVWQARHRDAATEQIYFSKTFMASAADAQWMMAE